MDDSRLHSLNQINCPPSRGTNPLVLFQSSLFTEVLPAHLTVVRLFSRVDAQVCPEIGLLAEVLATLLTVVRFEPGVNALVFPQGPHLPETLPALVALVRFLPRMHADVYPESGIGGELLAALLALVRCLSVVSDTLVQLEVPGRFEALSTLLALVRPLSRVHSVVGVKIALPAESLPTDQTRPRSLLLPGVCEHVCFEITRLSEVLRT